MKPLASCCLGRPFSLYSPVLSLSLQPALPEICRAGTDFPSGPCWYRCQIKQSKTQMLWIEQKGPGRDPNWAEKWGNAGWKAFGTTRTATWKEVFSAVRRSTSEHQMVSQVLDQTEHNVRGYPEKRCRRRREVWRGHRSSAWKRRATKRQWGGQVPKDPAISLHGLELALKHKVRRQISGYSFRSPIGVKADLIIC